MSVLQFSGVRFGYSDTTAEVLKGIDLTVERGGTVALMGGSGSGKSTAIKIAKGLLQPTAGTVTIDGHEMTEEAMQSILMSSGYVQQDACLFPHMTIAQNIAVPCRLREWDDKTTADAVTTMLESMELDTKTIGDSYPSQISGGQQQRAALARALVTQPKILLLDEPFGALDPILKQQLQQLVADLQKAYQVSILLVTHDIAEAEFFSDHLALLAEGKIVQTGSAQQLRTSPANAYVEQFMAGSVQ